MIGRVAAALGELIASTVLGERPDLVDLDENRIRHPALDAALQPLGVRDEEVVAHELDPVAKAFRQLLVQASHSSSASGSSIETIG